MKHIRNSNFNNLLVDVMNFGTQDIKPNAVYLDTAWAEINEYVIYLGPCDTDNCLSDSISFTDEFMIDLFQQAGIQKYYLHSAENSHTLYFDSIQQANDCFDKLNNAITSYGFQIYK